LLDIRYGLFNTMENRVFRITHATKVQPS
jgi:hypothetical protein